MIVEIIIVGLTMFCVIANKNKFVYTLMCGLMLILMTFNTYNADLMVYQVRYLHSNTFSSVVETDVGFGVLTYLCKIFGLTFTQYKGVICIVGIVFLTIVLFKFSNMPTYALWFYFLVFFPTHLIQMRAFLSEIIVVMALLYFVNTNEKKWWFKYTFLILIATLFHASSILYLMVLAFAFVDNRKVIMTMVVVSMFIIPVLDNVLFKWNLPVFIGERADIYMSSNNLRAGYKTYFFCALYLLMCLFVLGIIKKREKNPYNRQMLPVIQRMNLINIMGIIFCGFIIVYNNNFYRYNRTIIMLNYIVLLNYYKDRLFKSNVRVVALILISVVVFILSEILMGNWYQMIINNTVLNV